MPEHQIIDTVEKMEKAYNKADKIAKQATARYIQHLRKLADVLEERLNNDRLYLAARKAHSGHKQLEEDFVLCWNLIHDRRFFEGILKHKRQDEEKRKSRESQA